jgi:tetratricopeptide (TPR) repeat protein
LDLGLQGEPHYWVAKCLLNLNQVDAPFKLISKAFDDGTLPKDYGICYLKLLLLKGDVATVETLLNKQAKRFPAAHQHWVRGVLALKADQPEAALVSFNKIKNPVTPGDLREAWTIYSQQRQGHWEASAVLLGLAEDLQPLRIFRSPKYAQHPVLAQLAIWQQAVTRQPEITELRFRGMELPDPEAFAALDVLELIQAENYHEAAHSLLKLEQNTGPRFSLKFDRASSRFPALKTLRPTLLLLAGQQSFESQEFSCAVQFWQPIVNNQPFNPQLAVNLIEALEINDQWEDGQRLFNRLLKWVEQEAKQNPQTWPPERLKRTQAHIHCRLADAWATLGRDRTAEGEVRQAERLCPTSPEVLGRRGLTFHYQNQHEPAIDLLNQALAGGCRYEPVYEALIEILQDRKDTAAVKEARQKYGKFFGDLPADDEVEVPQWRHALSTQNYAFFSRLVQSEEPADPPLRACQLFVESAQGTPTSTGKISINQAKATKAWDALLKTTTGVDRVFVLQAIALSIQLFAKRDKGIAALITQYMLRIFDLIPEHPEARIAHLIVLAAKETTAAKLQVPVQAYLAGAPQPGNAIAEVQLQSRQFSSKVFFRSFIDTALAREPQNPLLLLAKATTYRPGSPDYEQLKDQGFEIARRVQDSQALKAFRAEQAFLSSKDVQSILPSPDRFDNATPSNLDRLMDEMLENMIRKTFGNQIPAAELNRLMPMLKARLRAELPNFADLDDEDDDDFDFPFGSPFGSPFESPFGSPFGTPKPPKGSKKGGRGFPFDLF